MLATEMTKGNTEMSDMNVCEYCGIQLHQTGCAAPGCDGLRCLACSHGCDITSDISGDCATALAAGGDV